MGAMNEYSLKRIIENYEAEIIRALGASRGSIEGRAESSRAHIDRARRASRLAREYHDERKPMTNVVDIRS